MNLAIDKSKDYILKRFFHILLSFEAPSSYKQFLINFINKYNNFFNFFIKKSKKMYDPIYKPKFYKFTNLDMALDNFSAPALPILFLKIKN